MTTRNAFEAALHAAANESLDFIRDAIAARLGASRDVVAGDRVEISRHVEAFFVTTDRSDLEVDFRVYVTFQDDGTVTYGIGVNRPGRGPSGLQQHVSIHEAREVHECAMGRIAAVIC